MRICISYYEDFKNPWRSGGGSLSIWEIGRRLVEKGHLVTFVTGNFPGAKSGEISDIHYVRLGSAQSLKLSVYSYYLNYPLYLKKVEEDFDILLEGWTSPFPFIPLWLKTPVVAWVHILEGVNLFKTLGAIGFPNFFSEKIFRNFYRNYILYSPNYIKLDETKNVLVCPPAFDSSLLELKNEEENYILFLGRLAGGGVYQKGIDMLFRSFYKLRRSYPNLKLIVAGNGDVHALALAQKLSRCIGGIYFTGKVAGRMKNELLRKCLFVCMPSRYESAGIVALEAQACGKPVVGFNIPGLNFVVKNGKTGILVKPFNLEKLTDAIKFMLRNPSERKEFGECGRKWAMNFTWEKAADKVERFLKSIV